MKVVAEGWQGEAKLGYKSMPDALRTFHTLPEPTYSAQKKEKKQMRFPAADPGGTNVSQES